MNLPASWLPAAIGRRLGARVAAREPGRGGDAKALLYGLIGVAMFSLTLPFTRLAVAELDAVFVAFSRAALAGLCAAIYLALTRSRRPTPGELKQLTVVVAGVVLGFPILSSVAMRDLSAGHGAIVNGVLPLATALFAFLLADERPSAGFWICALAGSALVVAFALRSGAGHFQTGDWAMMAAVLFAGCGYARGGDLARAMGGPRVISWALVLALPCTVPTSIWFGVHHKASLFAAPPSAWIGLAYISLFSMFLGFFYWYKGLALGGVARIGQVQLLQPFLTLFAGALILGEPIDGATLGFALAVLLVVGCGRRFGVARPSPNAVAPPSAILP